MGESSAPVPEVRTQVELLRKKLLDLTLRNRMLNYRPSKRLGLGITGEDSCEVLRILVEEGKKMTFVGKPDPARRRPNDEALPGFDDPVALAALREDAEDELAGFLQNPAIPADQSDTKLNTDEFQSALQAKLRTIQREAALANDELGINTLFLTLGAFEWCDTDRKSFRAPLVFVPVSLERQANGSMKLVHEGGDVGDNLPLRTKLSEFNVKLPEYDDDVPLTVFFDEVVSATRLRTDWSLDRNHVALGFFSYEKFAMYADLGGELWPEERKPWLSPDLVGMLGGGYSNVESPIDHDTFLDDLRPVDECNEVYDADNSQTLAMMRAAAGLSMVVEGPPGTGKSQTIANIIAEAVAQGKRVLFVSEKKAALDVVKRRFEEAGLGAMCLDLHDKSRSRREFYSEIKTTASMSLKVQSEEARVERLSQLRQRLNQHARAVNEPLAQFGFTPFAAMSELARLPREALEDREGRVAFDHLRGFTRDQIEASVPLVRALQERIAEIGVPAQHPFWGAQVEYLDPGVRLDLQEDLAAAKTAYLEAESSIREAAKALKVSPPGTAGDVQILRECAKRAADAPFLDGIAVKTATWAEEAAGVREAIRSLRTRATILASRAGQATEAAWTAAVDSALDAYDRLANRWYRSVSGQYRRARRQAQAWLAPEADTTPQFVRDLLRDISRVQAAEGDIAKREETLRRLFGVQWSGLSTDPLVLERLLDWVLELHRSVDGGELPSGVLDLFSGKFEDIALARLAEQAEAKVGKAIDQYKHVAGLLGFESACCRAEPWEAIGLRLAKWRENLVKLPGFVSFTSARRAVVAHGLECLAEIGDNWAGAAERLTDSFRRSYYTGVVREAMQARPELRNFERAAHESAVAEFQDLDDFKLKYNRARVRLAHCRGLPNFASAAGNLQLLRVQCELQRRHRPIRWIMAHAGAAVQRIKPVFMMSPLTVAIHLPPESPPFDMVIFDEASQVKPEDALCAIIRANQTIVVGDTRQLPPTSFFDRVAEDEDVDDEVELTEAEVAGLEAKKLESVLSMMSAAANGHARRPELRWHYRSVHPALIQPSNEMFYDNHLVVFPSATVEQDGKRIGIVFHHDPGTVYEPGASKRINRKEAELVAAAVLDHLRKSPEHSLMVASMNRNQADLIDDELAKRRLQYPFLFDGYESKHPHERLLVRNLENIQGDERDVVFISITYGRDAAGIVRQQFGPLLRDGGERRLNVLITRARLRCEVFSNLTSEDIRNDPPRQGLASLQRYLKFAQTGDMDLAAPTGREEESPFEEEVIAVLRGRGLDVVPQVGSEGFRIDMAVRDPKAPGRFVLGIECDGATYHSARTARDRDKLRQRVLESRGWRLHRIWSHDWWQDRDGETERLICAVKEALADSQAGHPSGTCPVQGNGHAPEVALVEGRARQPESNRSAAYRAAPLVDDLASADLLSDYLVEVVKCEGPICLELLFTRLRVAAGYCKAGSQVRPRLEGMIAEACRARKILRVDDAYYTDQVQLSRPRDWSTRPAAEKKSDFVTAVEIAAALKQVAAGSFGVERTDAVRAAFGLLGFKRTTSEAQVRGSSVVDKMLKAGGLVEKDGQLYVPKQAT
jgi:very-short-patch-repair endonuclease